MAVKVHDYDLLIKGYIQPTTIELGHATDTTLSRVSAGVVAIEGSNILTQSSIGSTVQAYDADLATVAAINSTTANVIASDGAGWIAKTYTQLKTALGLVKADVGLGNVDNTSDASKPVSTAQQTALNLKANLASPTFTGTVGGITKAMVGLTNVDDTSDSTKNSATATLTNKRITKRITTEASSATPTINTNNCDIHKITALAVNITSMTTNLTGTATDGQMLIIQITGTAARTITWGAGFESSTVTLPSTTVTTARLDVGFIWNTATSKWRCIAVS